MGLFSIKYLIGSPEAVEKGKRPCSVSGAFFNPIVTKREVSGLERGWGSGRAK